jgi:hypothetical protein
MKMFKTDRLNSRIASLFIYIICGILFFGYVFIALNNRFQFDDLYFSSEVSSQGIWPSFIKMYYYWETIYNSLLVFFLLKWIDIIPAYIYNIAILICNICCFYFFLKTVVSKFQLGIGQSSIFILSALVMLLSYYSCRAEGNVVYWVTGQIVYCLLLCYLFLGLHFWIRGKIVLASIFLFLFAHSRLNYDAIFIGLYLGYLLFGWYEKKKFQFNWREMVPFLVFLLGVITYLIIPGNYRWAATITDPHPEIHLNLLTLLLGWFSALKHLTGLVLTSWKQIMIIPIGIIISFHFRNPALVKLLSIRLLLSFCLIFLLCYIGQSTVMYIAIKTPVGYGRIFFLLELLLFSLLLLIGYKVGAEAQSFINPVTVRYLLVATCVFIGSLISINLFNSYKTTVLFAKAYDSRINYLLTLKDKGNIEDIYVPTLPSSGFLNFMEISPADNSGKINDNNSSYIKFFKLPFRFFIK